MSDTAPSPATAAEARVRTLLAAEKWRHARDELKPLVKADRGRFLPLLVEANVGLARKMLAGGQAAEAQQVINYLATIVPPERLRALELELAVSRGATEQSLPQFFAALAAEGGALPEAERLRLADFVVLGFEPVAAEGAAQVRLAAELRAVHEGLQAAARAEWARVPEIVRSVPHRSPLSHWAAFIKAVGAFHVGDLARASKLLASLPSGSVPAKAGRAYALLAGEAAAEPVPEAVLEAVAGLAGGAGVSGNLLRAERLWRAGELAESYRVLRDGVERFPTLEPDWLGALTNFYFKAPHGLTEAARAKFLNMFSRFAGRGRWKNRTEAMLAQRMFALLDWAVAPVAVLREDWAGFLDERRALCGPDARFESLACGWLGERLAETAGGPGFHPGAPPMRDPDGAIAELRRSVELDPGNLRSHLQLCSVYATLKKTGERNRLLDTMTARFPDEKEVLVRAAEGCIQRKAFGKGLEYLARARQLDQLDPAIPDLTVDALRQQARQQFQQRRADKARETLAHTEAWLTDKPGDFGRSRWVALVQRGVMEKLWGDAAQSAALLAEARARAPGPAGQALFAHLAHRVYAKMHRSESPFLGELKAALRAPLGLADIVLLLRILAHWRAQAPELRRYEEERLLEAPLTAAVARPFARAEAVEVMERARAIPELAEPCRQLVKKVLKGDPVDPLFRLWKIGDGAIVFARVDRGELESLLQEATRRHDELAVRKIRQAMRDLDAPFPPPDLLDPRFHAPDEDEEDDEDDDFTPAGAGWNAGNLAGGAGMPPITPEMQEFVETLRTASDKTIRELRRSASREMPGEIFDMLVQLAKSGALAPPSPPPSSPRNPGQLDLF